MNGRDRFHCRSTALRRHRVETGRTHRDHFDRRCRLHGSNGVTGIDRTLEGVSAFYRNDLGDLINVQLRSHTRQDVFAVGGRRSQDVAVAFAQFCNQRGNVFRQLMRISRVIGSQHLGHARNLCSGFSDGANALTCDQNVDVATDFGSGGYGVQRGRGQGFTVVFCDYQDSHV